MATKTQTQTTKPATKATNKATAKPASKATAKAVSPKAVNNTPVQAKAKPVEKAQTARKGIFNLVAGTIVSLEHKALKRAIDYHVSKGNLKRVPSGLELTQKAVNDWQANRVIDNPEQFQKIAAFVHGAANLPEFGGEKKTPVKVGSNKQLPSLEFWGSFATANMRLCFAALWSTRK